MFNTSEVVIIGFDYLNATELQTMQRNLDLLYSTAAGTCPGDRSFGLDQTFESFPTNVAQNLFALEVIEKTEIYEPNAEIVDIEYTTAADGNLTPHITIGPKEAEDEDEEEETEG